MTSNVVWLTHDDNAEVREQAHQYGLALVTRPPAQGFYLVERAAGLTLCYSGADTADSGLYLDFLSDEASRRAAGGKQSVLAKAFGLHRHAPGCVLDTTCGLGRDSLMLATLGCQVTSLERQPALHALLQDAYHRAQQTLPPPSWLDRWRAPVWANAVDWLDTPGNDGYDAIYIDPMFDAPRRKAKPQKALVWLAELAGIDHDAPALLAAARQHARRRVVVKQHARSRPLAPPDNQISGKAVRFDIYLASAG